METKKVMDISILQMDLSMKEDSLKIQLMVGVFINGQMEKCMKANGI